MKTYELVILESPFKPKATGTYASPDELKAALARELSHNIRYARAAMRDCLRNHGEAPSASHLLYTQDGVLDDNNDEERTIGIDAGLAWREPTRKSVVYLDRGISGGMIYGINAARKDGKTIVGRYLAPELLQDLGIPTVAVDQKQIEELGIVIETTARKAA